MRIGITDNGKPNLEQYKEWLLRGGKEIEFVLLSHDRDNLSELKGCDGLLMTGGEDVAPKYYGREDATELLDDLNEKRDEFEFNVVRFALERSLPILAICRGMQLTNVFLGGSLILDLETAGYDNHKKTREGERRHSLHISDGTELREIVGSKLVEVNSGHHQAVERIGSGLKIAAKSPDGVVEALEWEVRDRRPFLLLIQWHPERMQDFNNPSCSNILYKYLTAVHTCEQKRQKHEA